MARRNSTFSTIIVLCILGLAAYGSYVIWGKKDVQKKITQVERSVKAAKTAW